MCTAAWCIDLQLSALTVASYHAARWPGSTATEWQVQGGGEVLRAVSSQSRSLQAMLTLACHSCLASGPPACRLVLSMRA
jgi:hypothetical protein